MQLQKCDTNLNRFFQAKPVSATLFPLILKSVSVCNYSVKY